MPSWCQFATFIMKNCYTANFDKKEHRKRCLWPNSRNEKPSKPTASMDGRFTFMKTINFNHSCREIYTQTWNSVHFPKQHTNCMGRCAFRKSVQSVQKIVKQHGGAIPNMLLSMCSNHDFYQFISSKQHGDAWLKKVQKHLRFINKKLQKYQLSHGSSGYGKHDGHHGKTWSLNFPNSKNPLEVPHGPTPD